jgi:hypothetical protein
MQRKAPFLVVIRDIQRIVPAPLTAFLHRAIVEP